MFKKYFLNTQYMNGICLHLRESDTHMPGGERRGGKNNWGARICISVFSWGRVRSTSVHNSFHVRTVPHIDFSFLFFFFLYPSHSSLLLCFTLFTPHIFTYSFRARWHALHDWKLDDSGNVCSSYLYKYIFYNFFHFFFYFQWQKSLVNASTLY